jgi:hypothetical protein
MISAHVVNHSQSTRKSKKGPSTATKSKRDFKGMITIEGVTPEGVPLEALFKSCFMKEVNCAEFMKVHVETLAKLAWLLTRFPSVPIAVHMDNSGEGGDVRLVCTSIH